MKKRNSKKGFTLVELVIVIAVIAILASVLIPTFGGIIDKANASAAYQEAKIAWTEYVAEVDYTTSTPEKNATIVITKSGSTYTVTVANGQIAKEATKITFHASGKTEVSCDLDNTNVKIYK